MKFSQAIPAFCCAAAAITAHAQSSVQIYGVMDVFAGQIKNTGGGLAATRTTEVVNPGGMTTSFVGFRGTEDLGGGLGAVFALESFIRADTGQIGRNDADPFWGRLAVVGLESSTWGTVTLGRHVTPYSLATTNFTPFAGSTTLSTSFANVFRNNLQGDTRFNNSVRYRSPNMKGFTVDAVWSLGREIDQGPDFHRDRAFDGTLRYTSANWSVITGTRQINLNASNDDHEQSAYMIGGMYDFKVVQVYAQAHDIEERFANPTLNVKRRSYDASLAIPIGPGQLSASVGWTRTSDTNPAVPNSRHSWAIGYNHYLSKRTDLYAAVFKDMLKQPDSGQQIVAFGMRHRY